MANNSKTLPPAAVDIDWCENLRTLVSQYLNAGYVLTTIPKGEKAPAKKNWNKRENCIFSYTQANNINGSNIGLCHAYSGTCAIDIDNLKVARPLLKHRGVDIDALIDAPDAVLIDSGRENRCKLIFRWPEGAEPLPEKKITSATGDLIDFRCATGEGKTVQDVLPPSIHPVTGKPYRWSGNGDFCHPPEIPQHLLHLWHELLAGEKVSDPCKPIAPANWLQVDLDEIPMLPEHSKRLIREGNDSYPSRSEMEYGAIRDLIEAGCDDETICFVIADSQNSISEKALEQAHGDVRKAMKRIAKQIPKIRSKIERESKNGIENFDIRLSHNPDNGVIKTSALNTLIGLSATNRVDEMEKNLSNDLYVFPGLALAGQITLIYARPNSGKTLLFMHFIREAIQDEVLQAADVFYINADDSYKGLYTKSKIARQYGFHMICPAVVDTSPKEVIRLLNILADGSDACGKVFVLDTLKKFTDMMNKQAQASLYEVLRRLVAKNATVILAGHTNKHADAEGNLIYEGTSDTMNDVDCAYAMYRLSGPGDREQIIEFRREKSRGDVLAKVTYKYTTKTGMSYHELLDTVHKVDELESGKIRAEKSAEKLKDIHQSEILFINELFKANKQLNQTEIYNAFIDKEKYPIATEFTKHALQAALTNLTDIEWKWKRGDKNAKLYSPMGYDAKRYREAKQGS